MFNVGEELVSAYLQKIKNCHFVQQNLKIPETQGEIDVVGINLDKKEIYICEVAIHLITGLQYTKNNKVNNVNKITEKFERNIEYTNKYFKSHKKIFMLWTPIIKTKTSNNKKHKQLEGIEQIKDNLKSKYNVNLDVISNQDFAEKIEELKGYTSKITHELSSPVLRLFQIEQHLNKHNKKI